MLAPIVEIFCKIDDFYKYFFKTKVIKFCQAKIEKEIGSVLDKVDKKRIVVAKKIWLNAPSIFYIYGIKYTMKSFRLFINIWIWRKNYAQN
jgi:hypothetical protein